MKTSRIDKILMKGKHKLAELIISIVFILTIDDRTNDAHRQNFNVHRVYSGATSWKKY